MKEQIQNFKIGIGNVTETVKALWQHRKRSEGYYAALGDEINRVQQVASPEEYADFVNYVLSESILIRRQSNALVFREEVKKILKNRTEWANYMPVEENSTVIFSSPSEE